MIGSVSRSQWLNREMWVLLVVAAGWMTANRWQRGRQSPNDQTMQQVERIVSAEVRPGDAVTFAPSWLASQRWRLERSWSAAGADFTTSWVPSALDDPFELDGFKRLWALTAYDAGGAPEVGVALRDERLKGGLRLQLFELPRSQTVYDFKAHISDAKMVRVGPKPKQLINCRVVGRRQICGPKWWHEVYVKLQEAGGGRHRCVFVQPHPDGATVKMTWSKLPLAKVLEGRLGNRLWAVRHREGTPVTFRVRVGRRVRHEETLAIDDNTWHRWRVELTEAERAKPVTLEFQAKQVAWRQLCFDARLSGAVEGSAEQGAPRDR